MHVSDLRPPDAIPLFLWPSIMATLCCAGWGNFFAWSAGDGSVRLTLLRERLDFLDSNTGTQMAPLFGPCGFRVERQLVPAPSSCLQFHHAFRHLGA